MSSEHEIYKIDWDIIKEFFFTLKRMCLFIQIERNLSQNIPSHVPNFQRFKGSNMDTEVKI